LIRSSGHSLSAGRRRAGRGAWLRGAAISLGLWVFSLAVTADETEAVLHEVSFPQRHNQYAHVNAVWPVMGDYLELSMPSWTPGSYLIRDFAANVEGLQARDAEGKPREVRKISKNRWRIEAAGAARLTIDYTVWAGELNVATSWVEAGGALLNGASIFLYSEASRRQPQEVTLQLPPEWPAIHTALPESGAPRTYRAGDYDELVDSPIVMGTLDRQAFRVAGQSYALVVPAGNPLWDAERARDDLQKIIETQQAFWGVNPFDREYLFFNFFMGPFGGLEHDQGTVMMCNPWQMTERQDYIKWLGLVSHEFFHAWNVRRMRPAALADYDYDREMYTRELWLAEGLSSYYDDLLLFRAGLLGVGEYLELLAQEIRNYEVMPGRQVRSAEHASFDTWIKYYQPDENSVNSTVSYYRKGALIGFVTDTKIRRATANRASLDTVMRGMYERYGPGGPGRGAYPPGAFEQQVEDVAGVEVRRFVEDLLQRTDDPDVDEALDWYGLSLDRAPSRAGLPAMAAAEPGGLGVVWGADDGRLVAEQVILGHSGAQAGILPGDELLAIDGFRVTATDYAARIRRLSPGQRVAVTLTRHERLLTLEVGVQEAIPESYAVVSRKKLRRAEQERLETWLGQQLQFE
jgi:predicted metalloprotease with PDZ domain